MRARLPNCLGDSRYQRVSMEPRAGHRADYRIVRVIEYDEDVLAALDQEEDFA